MQAKESAVMQGSLQDRDAIHRQLIEHGDGSQLADLLASAINRLGGLNNYL